LNLVPTTSPMYFLVPLVSFDIISNTLNPQHLGTTYCLKRKFSCPNLVFLVFLACLFYTMLSFVVSLSFFVGIWVFLLFSIFCHHSHCLGVFLLLIKCISSPNQNTSFIWIFTKDVWIWECLLSQHPILKCPFKTLA
jgi:hypothetical protein